MPPPFPPAALVRSRRCYLCSPCSGGGIPREGCGYLSGLPCPHTRPRSAPRGDNEALFYPKPLDSGSARGKGSPNPSPPRRSPQSPAPEERAATPRPRSARTCCKTTKHNGCCLNLGSTSSPPTALPSASDSVARSAFSTMSSFPVCQRWFKHSNKHLVKAVAKLCVQHFPFR